ncbi:alanine/glycine:cation symporter family protein [Quadrisphaera sp. KR29]|uniref:alanine/glycine:cation symporter family protein n=1 Tax=Quadrisphaera sp. KR29 TaxID=3461391 RepID=UPI00404407BA
MTSAEGPGAGAAAAVEDAVNAVVAPISTALSTVVFVELPLPGGTGVPVVVLWLVVAAIAMTVYFGFIQARGVKAALQLVRGRYSHPDDPGEVPHFHALTSALSGTVGLGNIAGVGVAVTLGGPGATLWMIMAGLLGMATKFVECTLGVKYREEHADGTVTGGPFRYLPVAFARFGRPVSVALTGVYAVAILLFGVAGGNMFQTNQTVAQLRNVTGGADGPLGTPLAGLMLGVGIAVLVALVILGGMRSIGRVTSRLVPAMAVIYVLGCLAVIGVNLGSLPDAVGSIISGAFSPEGVAGGALGALIIGVQRAAFSNEAGLGSAAIAHSTVKTRRPVTEGLVASLEPFVDTVLICTMTALTIIIAAPDSWLAAREEVAATGETGADGVVLTSDAFAEVVGWFPVLLAVAVALFAFSTLVTWSYYGLKAWTTLFGRSRTSELIYKVVFLFFTVLGSILTLSSVLDFADAALFLCAFVNVLALYLLAPVVKKELTDWMADRREGRLEVSGSRR